MSKDNKSEEERSQKIAEESTIRKEVEELKDTIEPENKPEEQKKAPQQPKTKVVVAIDEKELNKVELAYFKRPTNVVILSDK